MSEPTSGTLQRVLADGSWAKFDDDTKRLMRDRLARLVFEQRRSEWTPYPWQIMPREIGPGEMWLLMGGRGTGKTDGVARYVAEHVMGPACDDRLPGGHRIAIVAPTLGDAVESCITGPSGLAVHLNGVRTWSGPGGTFVKFPNGAMGKLFGAYTPEDVERLRAGGNRCLAWWEELAAWRYLDTAMEHSRFGLRVGPNPHVLASTTPKPRKGIIALTQDRSVVITRGRTAEAHHLAPEVRADLLARYGGRRTGRQELDGEILTDVEGALWSFDGIDADRVSLLHHELDTIVGGLARIGVGIDPAATNTEDSDETGIVVAGVTTAWECPVCGDLSREGPDGKQRAGEPHAFVLEDASGRYSAEAWAARAVTAYHEWEADVVIAEVNNGGDMVGAVIRAADSGVKYQQVRATRGKMVRAEPIAAHYSAHRVHHVGAFPDLEDQQTTWTPTDKDSPDRMDAAVWVLTELLTTKRSGFASVA